jgi:hypothetical protein
VYYRQVRHGINATDAFTRDLIVTLPLFGFVLAAIRSFQMRVTITNSEVEVVSIFRTYTIPLAEIRGRRFTGRRSIYIYRRGKSRVWVNESVLRLDDFYEQWKASTYDLDKADRLKQDGLHDLQFGN